MHIQTDSFLFKGDLVIYTNVSIAQIYVTCQQIKKQNFKAQHLSTLNAQTATPLKHIHLAGLLHCILDVFTLLGLL